MSMRNFIAVVENGTARQRKIISNTPVERLDAKKWFGPIVGAVLGIGCAKIVM